MLFPVYPCSLALWSAYGHLLRNQRVSSCSCGCSAPCFTLPCVCFGRMWHQASTYSHPDAHGMIVSTQLCGCTSVCAHQTAKRQVGAQRDLKATCASCETCSFFWCCGIRGQTHEEAGVRIHALDKEELSVRQVPPTTQRTMQVYSLRSVIQAAWCQERIAKHA